MAMVHREREPKSFFGKISISDAYARKNNRFINNAWVV